MRAAPPLAFTVRRFGAWRAALGSFSLLVAAMTALWWRSTELPTLQSAGIAAFGFACALLPLAEARRARPLSVCWDGAGWQVGTAADDAVPGRLGVALDLGDWLLLRFAPESRAGRRCAPGWIALQRRGLEAQWHAVRSTLYSPLPAGPPGGAPVHPPE